MAFDISKAFGDLAPKGAIRTIITEIELHLIDNNPKNYYSMDGIAELAENIRMFGLMEPLIVKPTADGRYMLISGHRRRAALRMLAEEGYYPDGMHHKIDCILHEGPVNLPGLESLERMEAGVKLWEELKLLAANADTRVMSSADKAMEVRRIREIFKALAQLGYKAPGRTRDQIAETAKISASRVARLDVIDKGLKDQRLRNAWLKGDLKETSAYEVARFPEEVQRHLMDSQVRYVCEISSEEAAAFMPAVEADLRQVKHLPTEDDADAETGKASRNVSTEDTISDVSTSDTISAAADNRFREKWEADRERIRAIMEKEDDEFFEMLHEVKDMFFPKLDALNSRQEGIERLKDRFGKPHCGGTRDWGHYDCSPKGVYLRRDGAPTGIARTWTDVYDMLCTIALNDEAVKAEAPEPKESTADTAAEWQRTEIPPKEGRYLCLVDMNTTTLHEQRCDWKNGVWICYGQPIHDMFKVVAWYPLPEEAPRPRWWAQEIEDEEEEEKADVRRLDKSFADLCGRRTL